MNALKLSMLISLMSISVITAAAVTTVSPTIYAQSNGGSNSGKTHFVAVLNGESVMPPVKTNASAKANLALVGDGKTMSYNITGGPVDTVKDVTLSHTTGGRVTDIVVLRSATQKGLSGQANTASLSGNFTSSDFINGPKDMSALVKDILSGNVIIRVDTLKYPLGIAAGTVKPIL
jgi:hypothetical protein